MTDKEAAERPRSAGHSGSGTREPVALIVPSSRGGFFWEDRYADDWMTVGWYRTRRGAKIAASRHWGARLEWREDDRQRSRSVPRAYGP